MSTGGPRPIPMPAPAEDQITAAPPAPKRLGARGKEVWKACAGQLARQLVLTAADLPLLEEYCLLADMALECQQVLESSGFTLETKNGFESPRPEVGMLAKAREQMRSIAHELGLTPSARTRLGVKAGKSAKDRMAEARARLTKKA